MDVEDFVKDVLNQVTKAVNTNQAGGKTKYYVDTSSGVSFDLAVTTASVESSTKELSGGLKVKVIGAEASKSKTTEDTKQQSSRVQFKVIMHTRSDDTGVVGGGLPGFIDPYERF